MTERLILLNPGPVTLTERVRTALMRGDWCHREPEFAELMKDINARLVRVYPDMEGSFDAVSMTGSGTSAVEAMLHTFAPDDSRTLVLANGVYGERMAKILASHGKPFVVASSPWTDPMNLAEAERLLDDDGGISHVVAVHHETTTGRLNDMSALGALCRERGLELLLDAVSSFGAEHIDADQLNLTALAATANKCLHGVAGISFVVARKTAWAGLPLDSGGVYFNLRAYHAGQHGDGFSPFTQAVQVAFALQEALAEFEEEGGWEQRRSVYRGRATRLSQILESIGVASLLPPDQYSCVLRSYRLPKDWDYAQLHAALKEKGFVIYAGQGGLANDVFRIAHMGNIGAADLDRLCTSLVEILKEGST